jgi:aspartyl-tRNA(Asn)/glutamyl-tRNA(Gln) amidotransferase subunit A
MMDYYTIPMSLAGLPALSVPCGWMTPAGGTVPMPMGLQLCTPLFGEQLLLGAAHAYERATQHARQHAPLQDVVTPSPSTPLGTGSVEGRR